MKKLLIILILGLVLVSGCGMLGGKLDVTPIIKTLPEVQEFLRAYPNAEIKAVLWDEETVAKNINDIRADCEQIPVKSYWKVILKEGNINLVIWLDADTRQPICIFQKSKEQIPISITGAIVVSNPTQITGSVIYKQLSKPELISNIPNQKWSEETNGILYVLDLNMYFKGTNLIFSVLGNKNIRVSIAGNGKVSFHQKEGWCGKESITFIATDKNGNKVSSNLVLLTVKCKSHSINNYGCESDSDCEPFFSYCTCSYKCVPKNSPRINCPDKYCTMEVKPIPECRCVNNKCSELWSLEADISGSQIKSVEVN